MAWLLRNSGNEERDKRLERVVAQKDTNVYLEAVEVAENEGREPKEIRNARMAGMPKRKHSQRVLGCCGQWYITTYHNKQKTCIPWILRHIRGIQVSALFMIEPPCTERYARWCERTANQLMVSFLLDLAYYDLLSLKKVLSDITYQNCSGIIL